MRKWLSITAVLIIFLILAIIAGVWQFNRVLKASHIENFAYHLNAFNSHRVEFSDLSFTFATASGQQLIQLYDLNAELDWRNLIPHIKTIHVNKVNVEQLSIDLPPQSSTSQTDSKDSPSTLSLPEQWQVPNSFPDHIHVNHLSIKQRCGSAYCPLIAQVDAVASSRGQVAVNVVASPGEVLDAQHQLQLNATYRVEKNLPTVTATVVVDKSINIELSTSLRNDPELYWSGKVKGSANYLDDWWTPYLKAWNLSFPSPTHESSQSSLNLHSEWQLALTPLLNLPATADVAQRKKAITGTWFLKAETASPINIFNAGDFSGQLNIDVDVIAGQLNRYAIAADVNAAHLVIPDAWQTLGIQAETMHLNIKSNVDDKVSLASLPVEFAGATTGALKTDFSGHLLLDTFTKKIIVDQLLFKGKAKQSRPVAGYEFENLTLDAHAVGYWEPDGFSFALNGPGQFATDLNIKPLELTAKSARLMATQLTVSGKIMQGKISWPQLHIDSDMSLGVNKLSHPQLKPNTWQWQGKSHGTLDDFDVTGEVSVGASLNVPHHVTLQAYDLRADWKVADLFLLASNPFADTLKAWPPLLSFARGKITASGNLLFDVSTNKLKSSNTNVQLNDIAGVYDTLVFEGLTIPAKLVTSYNLLKVTTDEIKINQINKGFIIGPVVASGIYDANLQKILSGKLQLKKFTGAVMDGTVSTPTQLLDFSHASQNIVVSLRQISLSTLLQQHPASELSGSGRLSGDIPIEITAKGIHVIKGLVAADAPGGQLKYQSARAAELAKTQPSMKLLTDALSDFHYSVLSSSVNYDENGKLLLSVRLEGKNPKLEKGRPINLNVNLEEDIPALLASMQLSSKVTDVVKKRLQETIQKKSTLQKTQ